MKIIYSSNEALYVPLRSVELISKYHKNDLTSDVILDSLSSNKWSKNKIKAKQRAYDHAAEILDIESRRQSSYAPSLKVDKSSYEEFIQEFPYKETDDQNIAIEAIKKDLALKLTTSCNIPQIFSFPTSKSLGHFILISFFINFVIIFLKKYAFNMAYCRKLIFF